MVSTRGVRYKFSEGERVLCYEPDPTKAKVLYDSKVLEVIETKDKRGRRTVEYLIHFQGWNSSWDRCVSEDFVLKDTEENRQLQRDLAEKSQLQLGAYLYRRERKKGGSTTTSAGGTVKRPRRGFSDDGSSSSTQPDEGETADTESSSGEGSGSQSRSPPPAAQGGRAHIALPSALRDRLTFDYHLVVKRGRLASLPASPCAAEILEAFVKWFARAGAWHPARARHDPPHKPDLLDVSCRLNLVREVADGLRVYFDFVLRGHLLYKQELDQHRAFCGQPAAAAADNIADMKPNSEKVISRGLYEAPLSSVNEMKSPRAPEPVPPPHPHPHGPDADHNKEKVVSSAAPEVNNHSEALKPETDRPPAPAPAPPPAPLPVKPDLPDGHALAPAPAPPAARPRDPRSVLRSGHLARRLRSHKSLACEPEEPAPSTSAAEPRQFENLSSSVGSSGSSLSEGWARPAQARAPSPAPAATRTPLSLLLDKVANWEIIPREGTRHLPCRVYGAVHLARLFVKLPDFLTATHMPDFKLKLILKHIDMFIQFLDEHQEWYDEKYYIDEDATTT